MSRASLLNVSRLEGPNTRASSVEPSFETWISRMAWRGKMGASAGTGMRGSDSGRGAGAETRGALVDGGPGRAARAGVAPRFPPRPLEADPHPRMRTPRDDPP